MAGHTSPNNLSTFARYQGLIKSILLFLLIVIAVSAFNIYTSYLNEKNATQITAAQQLRGLTQTITRDLYDLKLSQSEDLRSPHVQATIKQLNNNKDNFTNTLAALKNGGEIVTNSGQKISIGAIEGKPIEYIDDIEEQWKSLKPKLESYLKVSNDLSAPGVILDQTVDATQGSSISIYNHTQLILSSLESAAQKQSNLIRYLQLAAIAGAVVYFVIFMFYFVRRLTRSDTEANAARRETSEILDTVKTGLFLLDEDLNVGSQYSKELEPIIGNRNIGGHNFSELLEGMISDEDMNNTRGFIKQLYNPKVKERLISDLNPLSRIEANVDDLSGYRRTRYLDFKFSRVYEAKDIVRVLVNVTDITDTVKLEQRLLEEREHNDLQIDMLNTILNTDAQLIDDFIQTVHTHTDSINTILKSAGASQAELKHKLQGIFREVHSLKGISSSLNLFAFSNVSDQFEDKIKTLQGEPSLSGDDFLPLAVSLDELIKLTQIIDQLNLRISGNNSIQKPISSTAQPTKATVRTAMVDNLQQFAQDLAKRQFKQVQLSTQNLDQSTNIEAIDTAIRDIAIQVLRNAVVHGIETPSIRITKSKDETGHIQMQLLTTDDQAQLIVEDDGQGIDYTAIRSKAIESGMYTAKEIESWDQRKLLGLLFSSGFSTYGRSDSDAGRGVGLDVVKDRVQALGGKIGVHSQSNQFTRFSFTFPINSK